jgi:(p)ppGpp synthase/HD superfamily hydrolase
MQLEEKAKAMAHALHCRQYRKDKATPYIRHPEAVVGLLKSIGIKDEDILCAAWLHDVVEDCCVAKETIEETFNPNIARIVGALTRDVDRHSYKNRIQNADFPVKIIKLADYIHNCFDLNKKGVSKEMIQRKVSDYKFYTGIAEELNPYLCSLISHYLEPYLEKKDFSLATDSE